MLYILELLHDVLFNILIPTDFEKEMFILFSISILGRKMEINPWKVDSLEAFTCLKCPECTFFSKEESNFRNHATENHQLSSVFFEQLDSQRALYYKENSTVENISAEDLSKLSNSTSFSTGFHRAEISDTLENSESMVNTCAIIMSGQNEQFILSMDNFDHSDKLLSIQEAETDQSVSERLTQNGNSLEAEILPLHYPEISLTEGAENSFIERNIETVHERERNSETVHEGEKVKPIISKHHASNIVKIISDEHKCLVCEKTFISQSELNSHITEHHSDNIKNSNKDPIKCHVAKSELIQKEKNESVDLKKINFFKSNNSQIPESNSSTKMQENGESNDTNFLEPTIHKGKKIIPR